MQTLQRIFLPIFLAGGLFAQYPGLSLPPSGKNQKASVTQYIGPVTVTITYSSPAVHSPTGEDRRGKIWGKLVPYGMTDLGFGNAKMGPWRAGANENTVFAISNDVLIDGKPLPAGRYGVHMIPGENEWTIIFSKNAAAWGSFFYDPADDALRVTVKPHKNEYREWLAYDFVARRPDEATVELQWEELAVPWTVKVQDVYELNYARIRHELDSVPGFSPEGYDAAVNFCVQENIHLDQALKWRFTIRLPPPFKSTSTAVSC